MVHNLSEAEQKLYIMTQLISTALHKAGERLLCGLVR